MKLFPQILIDKCILIRYNELSGFRVALFFGENMEEAEYVPIRISKSTQKILREVYEDVGPHELTVSFVERSILGLPPERYKDILDGIFEEYNNATTSTN